MIAAWPGGPDGEEYALALDRGREQRLLILPALFDEANKLRHFTVEVMRRLDRAGIDCFLPDLPGCSESPAPLDRQTLAGWREAAHAAAEHFRATHVLTMRGGGLCAPEGWPVLRYAPATGAALLRGLLRARIVASREAGLDENRKGLAERGRREGLELAGHRLGATLVRELELAEPSGGAALANIAQPDLGGPGLWLRAEPDHDPAQADALAATVSEVVGCASTGSARTGLVSETTSLVLKPTSVRPEPVEGRHLAFPCENDTLLATLDTATGTTGLLLVTGGNEVRCGAFSGQAQLAARIAAAGHPVFRFDRRGVGDSTGENRGFRESRADIEAALAAFRREQPHLVRVVGFGNCDAASALMLASGAGCDALVLANPWTIEDDDGAQPPEAIRQRYAAKLRDPRELARLVTGKVSLRKLAGGLSRALRPAPAPTSLAQEMKAGLSGFEGPAQFLLAERDRTGRAFAAAWGADPRIARCPDATHAFVEPHARDWLFERLLAALQHEQARQLDMR